MPSAAKNPSTRSGDQRVPLEGGQQSIDEAGLDDTVVVEEEQIAAAGEPSGEIVAPRETGIHCAAHEDDVVAVSASEENPAPLSPLATTTTSVSTDGRLPRDRIETAFDQAMVGHNRNADGDHRRLWDASTPPRPVCRSGLVNAREPEPVVGALADHLSGARNVISWAIVRILGLESRTPPGATRSSSTENSG